MKTFTKMAAQGDTIIFKVESIPENLERIQAENGKIVVAHSETGHNHVLEDVAVEAYKRTGTKDVDLYELFLIVKEPTALEHLRSHDTHESILLTPGKYIARRQREYVAEGFRKAQD